MRILRRVLAVAAVASLVAATQSTAWAQPGRGGGGGFFGGGGGDTFLLMRDDVRKELEIVDDQVEKLQAIQEEMRNEMRDMFSGLRDLPDDERRAKFEELRETMQEKQQEMQEKVNEVLLPNQRDRLRQIAVQSQMRRGGASQSLTSGSLAEELNVTDEQKEKIRALQEEVQKEYQEKVNQAQQEAREKLMSALTAEQRAKLQEMIGEPFEMQQDNRRGGGRRGGDRRGGNRDET